MSRLSRGILLAFCLTSLACSSGDYPEGLGDVAVVSISALPARPSGGLEITEAWVAFSKIMLDPCGDEGSVAVHDFPVDLLFHPPARAEYGTGLLEYCRVALELDPATLAEQEQPLVALVHGVRADGATLEIESGARTSISIAGPRFNAAQVTLGFDLTILLEGIDVDAAELDGDGVALIDAEHNAELLAAFEANLGVAPSLYADPNADGLVGSEELTPLATPE